MRPTWKLLGSGLAALLVVGSGIYVYHSTHNATARLRRVLHTHPEEDSALVYDPKEIRGAIQDFGVDRQSALAVLKEASNDPEQSVRASALFGMGQLGKSVPEAAPFLWGAVYAPAREALDRVDAFRSLAALGFEPQDIPALAKLISDPVKVLTVQLLQRAGAVAKPVVPDLLELARVATTPDLREQAFLAAGRIEPDLRKESPEVDQPKKKRGTISP